MFKKRRESSGDEDVELSFVRVEAETGAAWLVVFQERTESAPLVQAWMPRSRCDLDEDGRTITTPRWLVEKNGLDGFA